MLAASQDHSDIESVLATAELDRRPCRAPDNHAENRALLELTRELAESPREFFSNLVETALKLSRADSAGISLLNAEQKRFVWPAVAGKLIHSLGDGTPSDFAPCGPVLDRRSPLLFQHPERHFPYLSSITPPLEEVLLIPFYFA